MKVMLEEVFEPLAFRLWEMLMLACWVLGQTPVMALEKPERFSFSLCTPHNLSTSPPSGWKKTGRSCVWNTQHLKAIPEDTFRDYGSFSSFPFTLSLEFWVTRNKQGKRLEAQRSWPTERMPVGFGLACQHLMFDTFSGPVTLLFIPPNPSGHNTIVRSGNYWMGLLASSSF